MSVILDERIRGPSNRIYFHTEGKQITLWWKFLFSVLLMLLLSCFRQYEESMTQWSWREQIKHSLELLVEKEAKKVLRENTYSSPLYQWLLEFVTETGGDGQKINEDRSHDRCLKHHLKLNKVIAYLKQLINYKVNRNFSCCYKNVVYVYFEANFSALTHPSFTFASLRKDGLNESTIYSTLPFHEISANGPNHILTLRRKAVKGAEQALGMRLLL